MNDTSQLKNDLEEVNKLLHTNNILYYFKKGVRLVFEVILYIISVFIFIEALLIPQHPFTITEVHESFTILHIVQVNEVTQLMNVIRFLLIIFSFISFIGGLFLRSVRRKNNRVKDAHEIVSRILSDSSGVPG